jgi:hypothetical protein
VLQQPLASLLTWLVIGIAIALPSGLWLSRWTICPPWVISLQRARAAFPCFWPGRRGRGRGAQALAADRSSAAKTSRRCSLWSRDAALAEFH